MAGLCDRFSDKCPQAKSREVNAGVQIIFFPLYAVYGPSLLDDVTDIQGASFHLKSHISSNTVAEIIRSEFP